MSPEEIKTLVESLGSIIGVLRDADPRDKAAIYANLGLRMTYNPAENKMIVEARPSTIMHEGSCPRGESNQNYMIVLRTELALTACSAVS